MKEHEYQEGIREIGFYFLAAPAVILLGMGFVGAILDALLGTDGTFSKLFVYIGGIPGVGAYYVKRWKEFCQSGLSSNQVETINKTLKKTNSVLERLEKKLP